MITSDILTNCTYEGDSYIRGNSLCVTSSSVFVDSQYIQIGGYSITLTELEHKLRLLDILLKEKFPEEYI